MKESELREIERLVNNKDNLSIVVKAKLHSTLPLLVKTIREQSEEIKELKKEHHLEQCDNERDFDWFKSQLSQKDKQIKELVEALKSMKTGKCWCAKGIGHPSYSRHTEDCLKVQQILEKYKEEG